MIKVENPSNKKYIITDIAHEKYPFLHRIRALQDIGSDVKAGDLGGFVESESNLSYEPGDTAWIYDDAVAAGFAYLDKASHMRGRAIICDSAYISQGSVLLDDARAEDNAYIRGSVLRESARASGNAMILESSGTHMSPELSGNSVVYGKVVGEVRISGSVIVFDTEEISNPSLDTFVLNDQGRSIVRDSSRNELFPQRQADEKPEHEKPRRKPRRPSR